MLYKYICFFNLGYAWKCQFVIQSFVDGQPLLQCHLAVIRSFKVKSFSWRALNRTGFGELYQLELGRRPWAPLVVPLWATMEPRYVYVTRSWSTLAEHQRGYRQLLLFISFFCWIAYFLFLPANAFMFHYMLTLVADSPQLKDPAMASVLASCRCCWLLFVCDQAIMAGLCKTTEAVLFFCHALSSQPL